MRKHIDLWLEGWRRGDAAMVMSSVSDDFVHDDPVDGRFTKAEFAAYVEELFATECTPEGFETITRVVTVEQDGVETTWGWWTTLRVPLEGAGLVKARPDGVYLERVAYSTRGLRDEVSAGVVSATMMDPTIVARACRPAGGRRPLGILQRRTP